jgi:hypothetical protein
MAENNKIQRAMEEEKEKAKQLQEDNNQITSVIELPSSLASMAWFVSLASHCAC